MTIGVDFVRSGALPAPRVSTEQAEQIAAAQFGLVARAQPLGSQQDSNFLLLAADSTVLGVLKIANPAFTAAEIAAQDAAAGHLAATVSAVITSRAVAERDQAATVPGHRRRRLLHRHFGPGADRRLVGKPREGNLPLLPACIRSNFPGRKDLLTPCGLDDRYWFTGLEAVLPISFPRAKGRCLPIAS